MFDLHLCCFTSNPILFIALFLPFSIILIAFIYCLLSLQLLQKVIFKATNHLG